MLPSAWVSSVMCSLSRAEMVGGAIRGPLFFPGARTGMTLSYGEGTE